MMVAIPVETALDVFSVSFIWSVVLAFLVCRIVVHAGNVLIGDKS